MRKTQTAIELFREWHTSVITASGFLITVPLLALSLLAASNRFSPGAIVVAAIPTLLSAACFALAIHRIAASLELEGLALLISASRDDSAAETLADARWSKRLGRTFFELGIGLLVFSILVVAIELV